MPKIAIYDACFDCAHYHNGSEAYYPECLKMNKNITDIDPSKDFPSWCPLETV